MIQERIQESLPLFTSIRVLVPGTGPRFRCGGLSVALQTARLLSELRPTEVVTYREKEPDHPFLDDLLASALESSGELWLVSWGFDVPMLLKRLRGRSVAYQAHSTGYGFDLSPGVPVIAVSRNSLSYWADRAPRNPLYLVPNALEPQWLIRGEWSHNGRRPVDVLVQKRKSSPYVLESLVPALRQHGLRVEVQSGWVDDLVNLFNRATVYLYDSADYWRGRGVSEGFGLPPLEALSCGCVVFSSFNHALADLLTPGGNAHQIGQGSLVNDLVRIKAAVSDPETWRPQSEELKALLLDLSESRCSERWHKTLSCLDELQRHGAMVESEALRASSSRQLRWHQRVNSFRRKVVNRFSDWPFK
ncbi:glycosyltransferase [Synechococcus sp. CC9311]|uniref:glycosyltransferase n=1 Tax=Synechococcus sp. (strain CC9311) TaxID=64471 RepID=UPI0000DDA9EA|nr:conserved hypothetical protein [Synechococcus sp. CC9311]